MLGDDGSTDGTRDIVREFAARHPKVRLVTRTGTAEDVLRLVREGMADVALVAQSDAPGSAAPTGIPASARDRPDAPANRTIRANSRHMRPL